MLHEQCAPRDPASGENRRTKLCSSGGSPRNTERFSSSRGLNYGLKPEPEQKALGKSNDSSLDHVIRLAQRRDSRAFEHIYRLHCRPVYSLCLRLVRDPVEAEDLAQEVFMQLFRKIHTFRGESAFSSWLYRLTANLVFMSFRKKKLLTNSLESSTETDNERTSAGHEIAVTDLWLSGLFDRMNLDAAIKELPKGYKAIFVLHEVQGYEHNEIAKILGCSVGNCKSQLHKARKRLRRVLRGLDSGCE